MTFLLRTQNVTCFGANEELSNLRISTQWIFQVPVKGGRDYITPQRAMYKSYGDYMPPTTLYRNLKNPLIYLFV